MNSEEKIKAIMILEAIGRPAEHLIETLENIIKEIESEKDVFVKFKDIKKPIEMKENKEFFTTFAELEIEAETLLHIALLLFKYMPSHIEIISPEKLNLASSSWNDVLNEIIRRLHAYDEIARISQIQISNLMNQIKNTKEKSLEDKKLKNYKKTKKGKSKSKKRKN
ncbi:MAG: hypothetical protein KatS3mg001_442 [Candidatus Pacearchaeota archaeon]|nr:MAG: hypothetical protein KatS3mg001_442 [Candidatus Pacearchaeota archaeon]